jgi:septal ring factor EnvC (AmiA/AmiB activator)
MLRRGNKSATTLDQTKQQLAQQEAALRVEQEKLERLIAEAPRVAEEQAKQQREELRRFAGAERTRLDVSIDRPIYDYDDRPTGTLRKHRREGRIIFMVLVVALIAAVAWLLTHLQIF